MTLPNTLLAAGGDLRQVTAAARLAEHYTVSLAGFDRFGRLPAEIQTADPAALPNGCLDALLLPMPVTQDGVFLHAPFSSRMLALSALLPLVKPGGIVLGGRITPAEQKQITAAGLVPCDYAREETFAIRNAVPTAEGCIQLLMQERPTVLHRQRCLILGAGRVSRALQPRLRALGAEVTVAARRFPDLARA